MPLPTEFEYGLGHRSERQPALVRTHTAFPVKVLGKRFVRSRRVTLRDYIQSPDCSILLDYSIRII
ncbi:hypothetical protein C487_04198 [Natrinema pallidum DSM 3751]|uniref:Uncharacterized protein n=1 Tax=Natrinema pallidum DSM 3751 TaxID=1227495 RepID=L9Z4E6_9EURY|nr:hypothetical protein C487_04198 [Natrinema pallidum DSM 3751]